MAIQKPFAVIPNAFTVDGVGNEKTNRPATHAGEFQNPGMVWESNGASSVWIRGYFPAPVEIDFFGLLGTNATDVTTMRLRLGDNATEVNGTADYDSGAVLIRNPAITTTDGIYHGHHELSASEIKQWFRIDIGSHTNDFRCMAIVLGLKRQFADFYNGGPDGVGYGFEDKGDLDLGAYGVVSENGGFIMRKLEMAFGWMTTTDRVEKFAPLAKGLGKRGVALWCFDPEATDQRQDKTFFGWLKELPTFRPSTWKQDRWTANFEILSMI